MSKEIDQEELTPIDRADFYRLFREAIQDSFVKAQRLVGKYEEIQQAERDGKRVDYYQDQEGSLHWNIQTKPPMGFGGVEDEGERRTN